MGKLSTDDLALLWICAFRYCLGRMTYVADEMADALELHWASIPGGARGIILRDLGEAAVRDGKAREKDPNGWHALGAYFDAERWRKCLLTISHLEGGLGE